MNTRLMYGIPVHDAMMNAAAFMTGGRMAPPVEAAASVAAVNSLLYPFLSIRGIHTEPVSVMLAATLPLIMPIRPAEMIVT